MSYNTILCSSYILNFKSIRLYFFFVNTLMTSSLKFGIWFTIFFSINNFANAIKRSSAILFRRNVFILLNVENNLSASADVIGIVAIIHISLNVSENICSKLLSIINRSKLTVPITLRKSVRLYYISSNSVCSLLLFKKG